MFVSLFSEDKKILFLELCKYAARSDNFFSPKQRVILKIYCHEMHIVDYDLDHFQWDLEYILNQLKEMLTYYEKREVTVEVIALLLSNRRLDPGESEFLQRMASAFEIDEGSIENMVQATTQLIDAQTKLVDAIMGE